MRKLQFVFPLLLRKKDALMDRPPFPSYSFQDYRFASDNVNQISLYVTDLILFSISPNADGSLGPCCLYKSHFNTAHIARRQRKRSLCEDSVSSDSCVGYGGKCRLISYAD